MAREPEQAARAVFRSVYDEHFEFVWRSLRRLGVGSSDAADAVQEVFLVVHRRLSEFEGRARLTTWLYRICLRVASDRRRRAHLRHEQLSDMEPFGEIASEVNSEDKLARDEDLALLQESLEALSFEQRAVFTLFELERMSCDDISSMLEIPLGTVYSRLRLGREAFRKAMRRALARQRGGIDRSNGIAVPMANGRSQND